MPRVKIDYIVSFSSEDPENQASNLLAWEVNKKKWLCSKGEPSCSVVLQLAQSVQICTVQVGVFHSAMVEVLVGRSETPKEPFQVLVPRSVFLTPCESRRAATDRVRSFAAAELAAARAQRWDRVRLVCSQPYDKHSKYGLSFVHIYSPEVPAVPEATPPAAPGPRPFASATFSSDEEEFRPGELFAQHRRPSAPAPAVTAPADTGAQIRRATSQALKNIPDSSIKLTKVAVSKAETSRSARRGDAGRSPRADASHKTDNIKTKPADGDRRSSDGGVRRRDAPNEREEKTKRDVPDRSETDDGGGSSSDGRKRDERRGKRSHSDDRDDSDGSSSRAGPHALLRDVVFVLSGYQHPRRAAIRAAGLALGAACERDWGPRCTHLICAFPNTPKLKAVRAGRGGARAVAVRGEWLEEMARRRRRLPWRWYATEPARRVAPPAAEEADADADAEECDTDDEIERVRRKMKKRRSRSPSPDPAPAAADASATSTGSDVTFVKDERIRGTVIVDDSDGSQTEEDADADPHEEIDPHAGLPDLFRGRTFRLAPTLRAAASLARYVRAYGGLIVDEESSVEGGADYVLCDEASPVCDEASPVCVEASPPCDEASTACGAVCVRACWVWRCHASRRLCDVAPYRLG